MERNETGRNKELPEEVPDVRIPLGRDGQPLSAGRVLLIRLFLAIIAGSVAGLASTTAVAALVQGLNPTSGPALLVSPVFDLGLLIAFSLPAVLVGVRLYHAFGER